MRYCLVCFQCYLATYPSRGDSIERICDSQVLGFDQEPPHHRTLHHLYLTAQVHDQVPQLKVSRMEYLVTESHSCISFLSVNSTNYLFAPQESNRNSLCVKKSPGLL